jgi:hypothetical protein
MRMVVVHCMLMHGGVGSRAHSLMSVSTATGRRGSVEKIARAGTPMPAEPTSCPLPPLRRLHGALDGDSLVVAEALAGLS